MPEQPMKVSYPALIVAGPARIPAGLSEQERKAAGDWDAIYTLLVFLERHGGCGGWRFNPATDCLACDCGGLVFEVGDPVTGSAA